MPGANKNNREGTNPYLAMREAKIGRNEKRLRELGLWTPPQPKASAPRQSRQRETAPGERLATDAPTRRSRRISSQTKQPGYKEEGVTRSLPLCVGTRLAILWPDDNEYYPCVIDAQRENGDGESHVYDLRYDDGDEEVVDLSTERFKIIGGGKRASSSGNAEGGGSPAPDSASDDAYASAARNHAPSPKPRATPAAPAANSVRSIDLDVETLLLGKGDTDGLLGEMMEHTGKEYIINESFSRAASIDDRRRLENTKLSYNKYCGVQDWKNAIFLWVNLSTSDSPNEFLDEARRVTWFGGSRMHDASPVVLKLLKVGQAATQKQSDNALDGSENIILWCRRYQPEVKKFTPYACFGRLGYRSHVPGSQPLSFVWDLLDRDRIKCHQDPVVRDTFDVFTK